jgi:hypothetical protein
MDIEETKREVIDMIAELQDEKVMAAVKKMIKEALPPKVQKPRKPGWGKGTFTYIADDFNEFIPPGFNEDNEIFP